MNRNWIVIVVLVAVLALMVGVSLRRRDSGGKLAGGFNARVAGATAPDFALVDIKTGQTVRLSDFRGKPVLLNFWATWCPPCKVEIPWFVDLQQQYGAEGLTVIGVAMDDAGRDTVAKFSNDMGINYPVVMGDEQTANAYGGAEDLPTTFYIGRDGKVINRVIGLRSHSEIEDNVKRMLTAQAGNITGAATTAASRRGTGEQ